MSNQSSKFTIVFGIDALKALQSLKSFSNQAKIALSGLAGTLTALTKNAIDTADELGKMAQKAGTTVKEFTGFVYVGKLAGLTVEDLASGFKTLSKNITEGSEALDKLGISRFNADGSAKRTAEVIGEIADAYKKFADGPGKTSNAVQLFGKSGLNWIPALNQGKQEIQALIAEGEKLGVVFDEKLSKQAEIFNDNLTRMKQGLAGIGFAIAEQVLPALIRLSQKLVDFEVKHAGTFKNIFGFLGTKGEGLANTGLGIADSAANVLGGKGGGKDAATLLGFVNRLTDPLGIRSYIGNKAFELGSGGISATPSGFESGGGAAKAVADAIDAAGEKPQISDNISARDKIREQIKFLEMQRKVQQAAGGKSESQLRKEELEYLEKRTKLLENLKESFGQPPFGAYPFNPGDISGMSAGAQQYNADVLPLVGEMGSNRSRISELQRQNSFGGRFRDGLTAVGQTATDIAGRGSEVAIASITTGIEGLGDAITGVITGAKNWAQVWQGVTSQIISMVVQMIIKFTILKGLMSIFGFATGGAAGAVTGGLMPGRAVGGTMLPGNTYRVGEKGTEYAVTSRALSRLGVGYYQALDAGVKPGGGTGGGSGSIIIVDSRQKANALNESMGLRATIKEVMADMLPAV